MTTSSDAWNALLPPPFDDGRNVSPLDEGLLPDNDPVDLLVRAVAMHIVTAIVPDDGGYGRLAALLSNSVPAHVAAATAAERWHLFWILTARRHRSSESPSCANDMRGRCV